MNDDANIYQVLCEIRDQQRLALERQQEQLAIAREQLERSRKQVQESIELQRLAVDRVKRISLIAVPGIAFCILMILYLSVKYL